VVQPLRQPTAKSVFRRVIDLVDDLGETLVEELTRNDRKTLVIDREQFH
jgi:hypothetical protein